MTSAFRRAALIAAGCLAAAGCSRPGPADARPPVRNLVIVTLDTTRADRLSAYGYMSAVQPNLDRLAREGVVFDHAVTVAPMTLPAHASLFTGLLPPHHGVRDNADEALTASVETLAERLSARGFRTGAFVGSIVLSPDRGLAQGFDRYDGGVWDDVNPGLPGQRRADAVVGAALEWLQDAGDAPFFLWAHLYDAHRPYDPPSPHDEAIEPYVGEIGFADAQLGRLLAALDARGRLDDTVIAVLADHGESLGDHGELNHGIFIYESVVRIPWFLRVPGLAPARVLDAVSIVDLMPTVLGLLGAPPIATDGRDLMPMLRGEDGAAELPVYAESLYPIRLGWSGLQSVRVGRFKLIQAPRPELYDLWNDPFEERNLHAERPGLARALFEQMEVLTEADRPTGPGGSRHGAVPLSAEHQERLAALGYVSRAPAAPRADESLLPDPKDCILTDTTPDTTRRAVRPPVTTRTPPAPGTCRKAASPSSSRRRP